jgi:hypothetical protein
LLSLALAILAVFASGCSSSDGSADIIPAVKVNLLDADTDDGGSLPDAPSTRPGPTRTLGSPLCNASMWNGCYPDHTKINANDCNLSADGGAFNVASGNDLGPPACHVMRANVDAGVEPVCTAAGTAKDGVRCNGPTDCASGYECVADGRCQPYCCTGDCLRPDEFCDIQPTTADPALRVPVCMPIDSCGLLDSDGGTCAPTETCAVVRADDGVTGCVAVGPRRAGDECNTDHCARGLTCLGTSADKNCYTLCHTAPRTVECGTPKQTCKGGIPLFPVPGIGICE